MGTQSRGTRARLACWATIGAACLAVAGCASSDKLSSRIDPKYGVSSSPRLVDFGDPVPKGGGTYRIGKPYTVAGRMYVPEEDIHYRAEGMASWYGDDFHGRQTANGEIFDMTALTAAHPTLLGRINMAEGQINFNGTTYELTRGDVAFSNPVRIEPILDVELTTPVRDYDISLGFHGPTDRLSTTYRSEPPLPSADIIALLAFGQTREEEALNNQPTAFNETASNAIMAQALNAAVSDRVQKLFGVSRIKIAPEVGSTFTNPNAQVTIEQQVQKNITLTYITSLTQSAQQVIQVEYNFNRNVSIVAVRDQFGVLAFDVRMRKRKR